MEWDLDLDLERLRDLEADFVDLDITALSLPQTRCISVLMRHIQEPRYNVVEMSADFYPLASLSGRLCPTYVCKCVSVCVG